MMLWWLIPIVVLIVLAIQLTRTSGRSTSEKGNALDILKERYARGEIDNDEFTRKKRDLGS